MLFHSHFGTFDVDAAYSAACLRAAAIWHMHSPYPTFGQLRKRVGERLKFLIVARLLVDRVVAVSGSVAESAVKRGGPRQKTVVVLNGIDLDRVRPLDERARSGLRAGRGVAGDSVVFLLFGWEPKRKGVDLLIRAVDLIPGLSSRPFRAFVVRGETEPAAVTGTTGDIRSFQILEPVQDVRDLYGIADCFVSASRAEGLPYSIGEAMASGLPVISSDLPQIIDAYGAADRGLLTFKTGDAEDLAAAMSRVLSMTADERRQLGTQNLAYARDHLSLDRWAENLIAVYRSVLSRRD